MAENLNDLTKNELLDLATEADVTGRHEMTKAELIDALSGSDEPEAAEPEPVAADEPGEEAVEETADEEAASRRRPKSADAELAIACYGCGAVNIGVPVVIGSPTDWVCGECGRTQATLAVNEAG